jgi:hypothetical protein
MRRAIIVAMAPNNSNSRNLPRAKRRQKLASLIGNFELGYTAQGLEQMRDDKTEHLISQTQATRDRCKEEK